MSQKSSAGSGSGVDDALATILARLEAFNDRMDVFGVQLEKFCDRLDAIEGRLGILEGLNPGHLPSIGSTLGDWEVEDVVADWRPQAPASDDDPKPRYRYAAFPPYRSFVAGHCQQRQIRFCLLSMLNVSQIFERSPTTIKNYGIWLRYQSRTGYHNMYKEYRDTTINGAVEQMYTEMASRHGVRFPCIQIIKTATVRPPTRKLQTTFKASRPNLFM
ncbi:hypothetical protein GUJ93_ZPchr0005g15231 [Zizania palustris]|uniref:Large ribosomal subunit protein eL20 domain-containing protein n=1 Tax=Zizania palustris TaxID=103762 RepID=A0A8J5S5M5_ZIZPA|nr:hypothetical protein GUJ93_ZPchr0005g15231 [Zizania palustris]